MWKLLRKDWLLNRRRLGLTYLFWSVVWLGLPLRDWGENLSLGTWSGMVSVACAFLPIVANGGEDKFKAAALTCSLPVTRQAIVTSRYVGGWLVALAGVGIAVAAMVFLSSFGARPLTGSWTTVPLAVVVVMGIVLALAMPFVLRFGVVGLIVLMVALQVLGMVALLAARMFRGSAILSIESAVRHTVAAVGYLYQTLGPTAFAAVAVATVLVLNVLSYRLSIVIYRSREF